MLAFCVGTLYKSLHIVVFLHPLFLTVAHNPGTVVLLGFVVHLFEHTCSLAAEHLLRVAHPLYQLGWWQLGHLFQRVEDVHHLQILLGGFLQTLHTRLLRHLVVVGILFFQFDTEVAQGVYKFALHQRQQRIDLAIVEEVLLVCLHLCEVAEHKVLVHKVVAALQVGFQQVGQHFEALALNFPAAVLQSSQLLFHQLLLLADDVVVVQNPFVGAADCALVSSLLHKQHVIACDAFHTLFEYAVSTLHLRKKFAVFVCAKLRFFLCKKLGMETK